MPTFVFVERLFNYVASVFASVIRLEWNCRIKLSYNCNGQNEKSNTKCLFDVILVNILTLYELKRRFYSLATGYSDSVENVS